MVSKDFNQSMDDYIAGVKGKSSSGYSISKSSKKKKNQQDDLVPEDVSNDSVYIIKGPKTFWQSIKENIFGTDEEDFTEEKSTLKDGSEPDFDQEEQEIEEEDSKNGFFSWLSKLFSNSVNESYQEIDEEEREEMKAKETSKKSPTGTQVASEEIAETVSIKPSIWQRLKSFFVADETYSDEEFEDNKEKVNQKENTPKDDPSMQKFLEIKEDLKQIAVISTAAFKRLPREQFKLFKDSSDFKTFKSILKKHNIIKVKEGSEDLSSKKE